MAVRGIDKFINYFSGDEDSFLLIGGAACDLWFAEQGLSFRATDDLDIVLIIEAITPGFVDKFCRFVDAGHYQTRTRSSDSSPELYRFQKPDDAAFPKELELFSRDEKLKNLRADQRIIPVRIEDAESLSAILLDDDYYSLIMEQREKINGIWIANAAALIPLKARAWIDLTARKTAGENVDTKKINKHRRDIFALAFTLPDRKGPDMPAPVLSDLKQFHRSHPATNDAWEDILKSIADDIGGKTSKEAILAAIARYFSITI